MVKVLGIDEAGRGPVIGPMIIAGVMIHDGKEAELGAVKDSKLLTHKKRELLSHQIVAHSEFKVIQIDPQEIDEAVDSKDGMNLNWLEAHKQAEIINNMNPDVAIIDCPSPNCRKYENYLRALLNNKDIKLIIEHKADVNYPVCSAASIIAKLKRDEEIENLKKKYGEIGPGYQTNEITQKFVKENWEKYPEIFRKSWATFKNHKKMKHQKKLGEF